MNKPKKGSVVIMLGLYILTIPFFNALNVTAYDSTQILGHFGESTTAFAYSNYIPVFAMLGFLPLGLKISKQIPIRTLVLSACFFSLICNTATLYTQNIYWFTFWRSLIAMVSITGIFGTLLPIIKMYNPTLNMAIMYGIVQFIQKGSQQIYQYMSVKFISIYDWTFGIYFLNVNFLICILITWLFYKVDVAPMKSKFQFDWRGWLLLVLFLINVLFICAEGQTRNWFDDFKISLAFALLFILIGMYVFHERYSEASLIDLAVYRYKNVVLGSFLFFYIGLMNGTGSITSNFMTGILGFDSLHVSRTYLPIIIGLFLAIPLTTYLLYRRVFMSTIWIAGFACFGIFHLMMALRFYPEIDPVDFFVPMILKGLAIGFLYPVSALYISEGVPKNLGDSRMMSGVLARVVFATLLGGAVFGTAISKTTILHKSGLSQQLIPANFQAQTQLNQTKNALIYSGVSANEAQKTAKKNLFNQTTIDATLLAYKEIYLVMSVICFLPIIIFLLFKIARRPVGKVEAEPIPL